MTIGDFDVPAVDLSFTNIQDTLTGGRHADISWNCMPVNDGSYSAAYLLARFYAPDQEETGGTFPREKVIGAVFSAKS